MRALIVGATGATGKDLLKLLLNDNSFDAIDIFVRRSVDVQHPKLRVHVIDFDQPEEWSGLIQGDVLFSCLGTTLKAAGSKEAQWKIDYEYQYNFAGAAKRDNVPTYVLVSAANSSPNSMIFYSKMKGTLEVAVQVLGFERTIIFRPPILIRKNTDRSAEVSGVKIISFLNKLGLFTSQKPMPTEVLAQAMIAAAKNSKTGTTILGAREIWELARGKNI